ncbi:hypothetical protein [Niallia sp. 03091]|uniref:hypothetical protein n=1 Tax=unclassified Niallia TaxID=2837522 RepID=UPI004044FD98
MKENKSGKNKREIKKEDQMKYSGQDEFSLQNISYAPGENSYLNENESNNPDIKKQRNHEFSEELSDGGERNEMIEKQSNNH